MTQRGENFIPYEQIEPLIEPGMTAWALGQKLRRLLGLPTGVYQLRIPGTWLHSQQDVGEAIQQAGGVVIEKRGATSITDVGHKIIKSRRREGDGSAPAEVTGKALRTSPPQEDGGSDALTVTAKPDVVPEAGRSASTARHINLSSQEGR